MRRGNRSCVMRQDVASGLFLFGEKNAMEDHIVTRSVDDCNAPVQKMSTTQKKKQKAKERGGNLNAENQKAKEAEKGGRFRKEARGHTFANKPSSF